MTTTAHKGRWRNSHAGLKHDPTGPNGVAEDLNANSSPDGSRQMWLCIMLGLLVVGALFWFAGITWWTFGLAVIMLGCPLVMIWMLLGGFDR